MWARNVSMASACFSQNRQTAVAGCSSQSDQSLCWEENGKHGASMHYGGCTPPRLVLPTPPHPPPGTPPASFNSAMSVKTATSHQGFLLQLPKFKAAPRS